MIPTWIIVIDYVLGMIMWTLIGRAAMNIFQREDSNFFFMSFDVGTDYTDSKKDDVQKLMLEFKYLPTRLAKILKSLLQRHTY